MAQGASSAPATPDQVSDTPATLGGGPETPRAMPAIDPTQENAALLLAIHGIVTGDGPEARARLYQTLLASTLYLVTLNNEGDETGPLELKGGEQLQLATIRSPQGQTFLPAFTDVQRLSVTLPPKGRYVPVPARVLCQMFMQGDAEGIVINPSQPPSGMLTKPEIAILANGAIPQVDENGQLTGNAQQQIQIRIQRPATPPDESFVNAIQDKARTIEEIEEVHLFAAGIEGQPVKLVIGILMREDLEPAQMQPAFEAVGRVALDAKGNTEDFDMMPLSPEVVESLQALEGLIYKKG